MKAAISVEGLSKHYRVNRAGQAAPYGNLRESLMKLATAPFRRGRNQYDDFWALDDVNFEVHPGEVVGVIGRNGAGKSTLLKILSRITRPTRGQVRLNGRVGSLLEVGTGFHPELSGRENIYLNGAILGMTPPGNCQEVRRHCQLCRTGAIPRHADQTLFERHVRAAGFQRGRPHQSRNLAGRRSAGRGGRGLPEKVSRPDEAPWPAADVPSCS